jgi:hypothetical protein
LERVTRLASIRESTRSSDGVDGCGLIASEARRAAKAIRYVAAVNRGAHAEVETVKLAF